MWKRTYGKRGERGIFLEIKAFFPSRLPNLRKKKPSDELGQTCHGKKKKEKKERGKKKKRKETRADYRQSPNFDPAKVTTEAASQPPGCEDCRTVTNFYNRYDNISKPRREGIELDSGEQFFAISEISNKSVSKRKKKKEVLLYIAYRKFNLGNFATFERNT